MKLDQYSKFSGWVLLYGADKKAPPLRSQPFNDHEKMIEYVCESVGSCMRKSDISKLTINVKRHSTLFVVNYISELYMSAWEKSTYDILVPGKLIESIQIYMSHWLDSKYAKDRMSRTEIENIGVEVEI